MSNTILDQSELLHKCEDVSKAVVRLTASQFVNRLYAPEFKSRDTSPFSDVSPFDRKVPFALLVGFLCHTDTRITSRFGYSPSKFGRRNMMRAYRTAVHKMATDLANRKPVEYASH